MKKKKIKYIVLLIIATILLVADLVILGISGKAISGMPQGMGFMQNGEMPEGFEGGSMPEGFDPENMPEGFEGGSMPEDFDIENMPGNRNRQNIFSTIGKVRIVCIVVAILCAIVDLFCIMKLIKIRKEEQKLKEQRSGAVCHEAKTPDCPIDPVQARLLQKKKNRWKWLILGMLILFIVILLQVLSKGDDISSSSTVKEEVISSVAEQGTIDQTIKGSGVLETASDVEVSVPGNIHVTKYLVSNGDFVEAREPIAVVEKKSVMAAIADLQEVIDEVDDAMEEAKEDAVTSTIKASVDGTVVAVYAKKGEKVLDIMYEKESLILLSLDDLLALEIANPGNVNVGDKFTVKDADGNLTDGKISQVKKETVIVTVPLSNFSYQEEVTVYDAENKTLGSGKLSIYSRQKVTGFSGTINSVKVSKGDKVSAGDTLLTLTDTDYTAAYQNLLNKRMVLEEQYNQLVEVANTGYVYTKEAGTIGNLDDTLVANETGSAGSDTKAVASSEETKTSASGRNGGVVMTSYGGSSNGFLLTSHGGGNKGFVMLTSMNNGNSDTTVVSSEDSSVDSSTEESGEVSTEDPDEGSTEPVPKETISKSVSLVWLNSDGNEMAEGMPESVNLQLCNGELVLDEQSIDAEKEWKYTWNGLVKYGEDGKEISYSLKVKDKVEGYTVTTQTIDSVTLLIFTKIADKTPSINKPNSGQQEEIPNDDHQQGNLNTGQPDMVQGENQTGGMPSMNGTPNFSMNGSGTMEYSGGTVTEETEPDYTFEETVLCSLSPNEVVEIPIVIDELDINSVKEGQKCIVTLDAFVSQSFEGVIEDINYSGENEGGNTKYTVIVSMEKNADMLLGMNASVTISLGSVSNILVIPVESLVEQDGTVYVYTEYDEKKDELKGLIEVTTGVSDGEKVQILDGLDAEQNFYYRYADTIAYSFIK